MGRFNPTHYDPRTESSKGVTEQGLLVLDQRGGTCPCGCGEELAAKSKFRMGHDARLKGKLIRAHLAGVPVKVHYSDDDNADRAIEMPALEFAARFSTEKLDWPSALRAAETKQGADVRKKLESANRELLRRATGPQVGDRRLVKVGRWEYTGQVAALFEADGEMELEYVDRKGNTKTVRQPLAS